VSRKLNRTRVNYRIGQQVIENNITYSKSRRMTPIKEIRKIMGEKGIKSADIAVRISVAAASVSKLLSGTQNLRLDTLHKLADSLEMTLSIVFTDTSLDKNMEII
jgi:transcriptional regulator with XRE-family HTH domain